MHASKVGQAERHKAALQNLKAGEAVLSKTAAGCFIHPVQQPAQQGIEIPEKMAAQLLQSGRLQRGANGSFRYASPALEAILNDKESPLYRLFHRPDASGKRFLSEHQYLAGERLRADFERSHLSQRVTAAWSGERVDQSNHASISDNRLAHLTDSALDARRRLHEAFDAVGQELAAMLYYVCCIAGGLEQAERFLELPPRSGKAILSLALTRLARHYRLLNGPGSSAGSRDIGHWALADYRPAIMPLAPPEPQP